MDDPIWYVYQLRSDTELLYVGYTRWLTRRMAEHRRSKAWWPEVTQTSSEHFGTEGEARLREKELWVAGKPKYNRQSPFLTPGEKLTDTRERVRAWAAANPERKREQDKVRQQRYLANPEKHEAYLARKRQMWALVYSKKRPTTVTGRRGRRWKQSGPGLF